MVRILARPSRAESQSALDASACSHWPIWQDPVNETAFSGLRHERLAQLAAGSRHEIDYALRTPARAAPRRFARRSTGRPMPASAPPCAAAQSRRQASTREWRMENSRSDQPHHANWLADGEHVHAVALGGNHHARAGATLRRRNSAEILIRAPDLALASGRVFPFPGHVRAELIELAIHDVGGFKSKAPRAGAVMDAQAGNAAAAAAAAIVTSCLCPSKTIRLLHPYWRDCRFSNVFPLRPTRH